MGQKVFVSKLTEFLDFELDDYDLEYDYKIEEEDYAEVDITRFDARITVSFKYEDEKLYIDMHEDSWEEVAFYETSVKYFWMLISPAVFV